LGASPAAGADVAVIPHREMHFGGVEIIVAAAQHLFLHCKK
jgi:hypothetical protein